MDSDSTKSLPSSMTWSSFPVSNRLSLSSSGYFVLSFAISLTIVWSSLWSVLSENTLSFVPESLSSLFCSNGLIEQRRKLVLGVENNAFRLTYHQSFLALHLVAFLRRPSNQPQWNCAVLLRQFLFVVSPLLHAIHELHIGYIFLMGENHREIAEKISLSFKLKNHGFAYCRREFFKSINYIIGWGMALA